MEDLAPYNDVALGIGAKGPIFSRDKAIAAVEIRESLPGKDVWVYVRHLEDGSLKYSLTNAPAEATLDDIRKPALMRWSIDAVFQGAEGLSGDGPLRGKELDLISSICPHKRDSPPLLESIEAKILNQDGETRTFALHR
jgi:hypothetical protein